MSSYKGGLLSSGLSCLIVYLLFYPVGSLAISESPAMQSFKSALVDINNDSLSGGVQGSQRSQKDMVSLAIARASKGLSPQEAAVFAKELVRELAGTRMDVGQYFGYLGNPEAQKLGQWAVREGALVNFKDELSTVTVSETVGSGSGSGFPLRASVSGKLSKIFVSSNEEFGDEPLAFIEVSGTWIAVAIAQQISSVNESAALDVAIALGELHPRLANELCATLSALLPKLGNSFMASLGGLYPLEASALAKTESEFVYDSDGSKDSTVPFFGGASSEGFIPFPWGLGGGGGVGGGIMYGSN